MQITLGGLRYVSLGGLTGMVPLASLGPVAVGPGPVEKSSIVAPQGVQLYLDPLASMVQKQVGWDAGGQAHRAGGALHWHAAMASAACRHAQRELCMAHAAAQKHSCALCT